MCSVGVHVRGPGLLTSQAATSSYVQASRGGTMTTVEQQGQQPQQSCIAAANVAAGDTNTSSII